MASGVQTGLESAPVFNGHYFTIGEAGYVWLLGQGELPGKFAVGGWAQTGTLQGCSAGPTCARPGVTQNGSQFGFNDSNTMIADRYFGLGLTAFGLVPQRPVDSMGAGLAWSWLNRLYGFRSNEAILQAYYQAHLIGTSFFEPAISYIPNPGASPQIQGAIAMTAQLTILF
ncbi:MAG: carbohydrate porin [Candidatus Binataceae bacterium]